MGTAFVKALAPHFEFRELAGQCRFAGLVRDDRPGQFRQGLFAGRHIGLGFGQLRFRGNKIVRFAGLSGTDFARFGFQFFDRLGRVAAEIFLSRCIGVDNGDAVADFLAQGGDAAFLGIERVAGDHQALQHSGGFGFLLAQSGQNGRRIRLRCCCRRDRLSQFRNQRFDHVELFSGGFAFGLRSGPAQVQQDRFVPFDVIRQVAVARRLAGLTFQQPVLFFQRADDVFQPIQVGFGRAQPQFGFMAAGMQPGDAGGLFEQASTLGRLRIDDGPDTALAHHCGRPRAGRRVGEQRLDVARAHVHAIDLVVRSAATLDSADDVELVGVVELGWCRSARIVHSQDDFGEVPRRAVGRSREDHVVHFAAAHLLGRGFAHSPAKRFDQIRLAAAVRADNTGQTFVDNKLRGLDERLEAGNTHAGELHRSETFRYFELMDWIICRASGSAGSGTAAGSCRRHSVRR